MRVCENICLSVSIQIDNGPPTKSKNGTCYFSSNCNRHCGLSRESQRRILRAGALWSKTKEVREKTSPVRTVSCTEYLTRRNIIWLRGPYEMKATKIALRYVPPWLPGNGIVPFLRVADKSCRYVYLCSNALSLAFAVSFSCAISLQRSQNIKKKTPGFNGSERKVSF